MIKLKLSALCGMVSCMGMLILFPSVANAQLSTFNPTDWEALVNGNSNHTVKDTFLMQTFSESPEDNWGYTIVRNAELFDAQKENIRNASEAMCLKLKPGAKIELDSAYYYGFSLLGPFAAHNLMPGENLHVVETKGSGVVDRQCLIVSDDNYTSHFQEEKKSTPGNRSFIWAGGTETYKYQIYVSDSATHTAGGFYAIDSLFARRSIKAYSLFTGNGNWKNAQQWSFYPASRNRNALIKGDVVVSDNIQCDSLLLGLGSVTVLKDNHLTVNKLFLNGSEVSLYTPGKIHVKDEICYQLSLPTTGQWYFISFPFDVYAEGIDPNFQFGDNSTTADGNIFYLKTYDGDHRSTVAQAAGNWKTVPANTGSDGTPIFKKGEGYLIALDAKASQQILKFTTQARHLPANFAKEGSISVNVSPISGTGVDEHRGWFLCGNPFPAPISVSDIIPNARLDGQVYLYEDGTFKHYPIGSEKILPPLSAFFVKANSSTTLQFRQIEQVDTKAQSASPSLTLFNGKEPQPSSHTDNLLLPESVLTYQVTAAGIQITGLPSPGRVWVMDVSGKTLLKRSLPYGASLVPLSLSSGVYILQVETGSDRAQYKFVWNR